MERPNTYTVRRLKVGHTGTFPVLIRASEEQRKADKHDGIVYGIKGSGAAVDVKNGRAALRPEAIKKALGLSERAWGRLIATMQLRDAFEKQDDFGIRKSLGKLQGQSRARLSIDVLSSDFAAQIEIAERFAARLKTARLILWWNRRTDRLEPAFLCRNLNAALFVMVALSDLRGCPLCDNVFRPERPDQQYCSIICRERFRKRRFRDRKGE